jgi:hypothetical protein
MFPRVNESPLLHRARKEAASLSNEKLATLYKAGPDGMPPDAWRALTEEHSYRTSRASTTNGDQPGASETAARTTTAEQAPTRWGGIGFRKTVELGTGIAVGFAGVGIACWLVAVLLLHLR